MYKHGAIWSKYSRHPYIWYRNQWGGICNRTPKEWMHILCFSKLKEVCIWLQMPEALISSPQECIFIKLLVVWTKIVKLSVVQLMIYSDKEQYKFDNIIHLYQMFFLKSSL